MNAEKPTESTPPYVAYKSFTNCIGSLRESGLPNRIDRSIFPGLSGATQSFLLATLRFLGLINSEGTPSPSLKDVVENPHNERAVLSKAIKEKYSFIFDGGFNINSATASQLEDKFRERGLSGQTIRKAVSFFTALCESSGIPLSPHLKPKRGSATNGVTTTRRYKKRKVANEDVHEPPPSRTTGNLQSQLLAKFPDFDPNWKEDQQKQWFSAFEQFMASVKKSETGE
jgi:hypothetical protein